MKLRKWLVGAAIAAAVPGAASAAVVTLDGAGFDIQFDDSMLGLFAGGVPTLVGDTFKLFPTSFKAIAVDSSGANSMDFAHATIAIKVIADDGYYLTGASLDEGGDYFKFGGAKSNVTASGELRMTSLSDSSGTVVDDIESSPAFPFPATAPFLSDPWTATASVSLTGQVTSANVTIQNLLAAWAFNADSGGVFQGAFIEKKNVILSVGVAPIPEPATWAMMATGAILLGFGLRRNRS